MITNEKYEWVQVSRFQSNPEKCTEKYVETVVDSIEVNHLIYLDRSFDCSYLIGATNDH